LTNRYRFHGYAIGAAGRLERPFADLIEVQASVALPQIGGRASARSAAFQYRDLIRFDVAHTQVTGSTCDGDDCGYDGNVHSTHLQATIEGLNVMHMVTADRIVANLVSTSGPDAESEPAVRLIGTRFENLRIAGIPVMVDLATDLLDSYDTHSALASGYSGDGKVREFIDRTGVKAVSGNAPEHIRRWFDWHEPGAGMPARRGKTRTSLVRSTQAATGGLDVWGHVIHVKGFGTVRLAEVEISARTRLVNMLQIDLDCPYRGRMMFCEIADGGETF
jgi:hypothetical protein